MPLACLSREFAGGPEPHGIRCRGTRNPEWAVDGPLEGVLAMLDATEIEIQGTQHGDCMRRMKTPNHVNFSEREATNA